MESVGTPRLRHSQAQSPTLRTPQPQRLATPQAQSPLAAGPAQGALFPLSAAQVAPVPPPADLPPVAGEARRRAWQTPALPGAESEEPQAFERRFGDDPARIGRARDLALQASVPQPDLEMGAAADAAGVQPGRGRDAIDVMALLRTYEDLVPLACLGDHERTLSAMELLVAARVQPHELRELVARGQSRDVWRTLVTAELAYALSFGAAGATTVSLADQPLLEAAEYGPAAADLVKGLNFSSVFSIGSGIIAVGGEVAQAMIREGKMGPRYNAAVVISDGKRTAFADTAAGRGAQRRSALPFSLLYGVDHVARLLYQTRPALRVAAGGVAAALSALYKLQAATANGVQLDPTWLDAATPEKRVAMEAALRDLRHGTWEASRGYCKNHLLPGAKASLGQVLSAKGAVRSATRFVAASVARAGGAVMAATGMGQNLYAQLGSEAWLGMSWGTLSTWPQGMLDGAARGRALEPGGPVVTRASVQAVAPPAKLPAAAAPR